MTDTDCTNKAQTTALILALRAESGVVKRSVLLEAASTIEGLQQENAFLCEMQKVLTAGMSKEHLGILVNQVWKSGNWR